MPVCFSSFSSSSAGLRRLAATLEPGLFSSAGRVHGGLLAGKEMVKADSIKSLAVSFDRGMRRWHLPLSGRGGEGWKMSCCSFSTSVTSQIYNKN